MLPMISRPGSDDLKPLHVQAPPGTAYRDKGMMKKIRAGCRSCRLVAPYVDLVGPRAHLRRVVPCLHPQQQVHAEAEGLLDP